MSWLGLVGGVLLAWLAGEIFGSRGGGLAVLGGLMGVLLMRMQARLNALSEEVRQLKQAEALGAVAQAPRPRPQPINPTSPTVPTSPASPAQPEGAAPAAAAAAAETASPARLPSPHLPFELPPALPPEPAARPRPELEPDEQSLATTSSLGQSLLAWFRGGNTIVRVAVLLLFIGVAFLLRYAAENALLPLSWRLAGTALTGLALTGLGLRLTPQRRGYGMSLQGAGVGITYLVLFAAFRLYGLVPAGLSFGLLAALAAITTVLALRQDALPLAALGFGGAFLAPVLTSTGQGSHVALFSYYLLLNLAIAWIARHKAWKLLNLQGFVFSFGIGGLWGVTSYRPELFWSTEPFLIAQFGLYLFIAVQYTQRVLAQQAGQADQGKPLALVDGSLLFGTPIVAFGLQAALLRGQPMALAFSAAVLAAIYLLLGHWLWRQAGQRLLILVEGMAALGLAFLALVMPLALDARWTSAAWAVQGLGVLWIALRQGRWWAAVPGILLQLAASLSYWSSVNSSALAGRWLFLNSSFLALALLVLAAIASAALLRQPRPRAPAWLAPPLPEGLMLGLGLLQLWVGGLNELQAWDQHWLDDAALSALWSALLALAAELRRPAWATLRWPARSFMSLALLGSTLGLLDAANAATLWARYSQGPGLPEALALLALGLWRLLRQRRAALPEPSAQAGEHVLLAWYAMLQGGLWLYTAGAHLVARHEGWTPAAAILLPTLLGLALLARLQPPTQPRWPMDVQGQVLREGLLKPWMGLLMLWVLVVNLFSDAAMAPLPTLPLLNPLDLAHGLVLIYALRLRHATGGTPRAVLLAGAGLAFWWLNSLLVRSLHHGLGTPMWMDGALGSPAVQTGLSLLWTLCALATMLWATRRAAPALARPLWMAGAGLLGAVVLKLFVVDLSQLGSLARIISFLAVGALMLVIGYVAPLPPEERST